MLRFSLPSLRIVRLAGLVLAAAVAFASLNAPVVRAQDPGEQLPSRAARDAQFRAILKMKKDILWQEMRNEREERRERAERFARAVRAAKKARKPLPKFSKAEPMIDQLEAGGSMPVPSETGSTSRFDANQTDVVPTNVRVNNPAGDGASSGQAEQHVCSLGDNVLVAWNDGQGFVTGGDTQGYGFSTDAGVTWTDGGDLPHPPVGAPFTFFEWTSDPVIAVNEKNGSFFYIGLADGDVAAIPNTTNPPLNMIAIARGHFSGAAFVWDTTVAVRTENSSANFLDKQWMVADSASGNLYVTNTTFNSSDQIDFQRSTNNGNTWSAPVTISALGDAGFVQGSRPSVGPNGDVYAVWSAIDQVTTADNFRFRRSTTGGTTWGSEVTAVKYIANFGTGGPGFNRERGITFPSIAVDRTTGPNRGRVYLTWNESYDHQDDSWPAPTPATAKTEVESNNTSATANVFTAGWALRGTLTASDLDYYSFSLTAGQHIIVWCDSMVSPTGYTLRIYAPDGVQRLSYGGDTSPTSGFTQAYYTFTAPANGTYFLRMAGVTGLVGTKGYRVRTKLGVKGAERGRDQRDAFVTTSGNGGTSWSTPSLVNSEAVGFDNWLPEVAVGSDGYPYVMWFDHRDDAFGSRAHIYMARSTDSGTTWQANNRASDVQSNFTVSASNIAPNHGDYSGMNADAQRLHPVWSDARDANINVYTTAARTDFDLTQCQADTTVMPNGTFGAAWTISNPNPFYQNVYFYTFTSDRNWFSGAPTAFNVPSVSTAIVTNNFTVPDTAAAGVNRICAQFSIGFFPSAIVKQCCFNVTVPAQVGVGDGQVAFGLKTAAPNPARGRARIDYSVPRTGHVTLHIFDLAGARVRTLVDGEIPAGAHSVQWNGQDDHGNVVKAGAYFYRLTQGEKNATQRLVFVH